MLSIVTPTLNEENHLPLLLESIKKQDFGDYEMIVADAGSCDKTLKIAENFGCKIVLGGLPPKGKNLGAEIAQGEMIFFIDADVILPPAFFKNALAEFKKRRLGIASFCLQSENKIHYLTFSCLYNFPSKITERILPQAMSAFMVERKIHQKIGGFDEKVKIGEELDYIRRGNKYGKFGVLKRVSAITSSRRFQKDGWLKTWLKYFLCQIHMLFFGPVKSDIFGYRFNHYSQKEKKLKI